MASLAFWVHGPKDRSLLVVEELRRPVGMFWVILGFSGVEQLGSERFEILDGFEGVHLRNRI